MIASSLRANPSQRRPELVPGRNWLATVTVGPMGDVRCSRPHRRARAQRGWLQWARLLTRAVQHRPGALCQERSVAGYACK